MFSFFGKKKSTQKRDIVDSSVRMLVLFGGLVSIFAIGTLIFLTKDSIADNQEQLVNGVIAAPSYFASLFFGLLGFLMFALLIISFTVIVALPRFEKARQTGATNAILAKQKDPTGDMVKLLTALGTLSQANNSAFVEQFGLLAGKQSALPVLEVRTPVLQAIANCGKPHQYVYGPTGSGKSTLTRHMVKDAIERDNEILILDPHAAPNDWPAGALVVGMGEDFKAIEQAIAALDEESKRRFKAVASGECHYRDLPTLFVLIAELPAVIHGRKNVGKTIGSLLVRTRKINFRIVLDGQSKTVRSMGLQGRGDMRDSLAFVELSFDGSEYHTEIDKEACEPCGPFRGWNDLVAMQPEIEGITPQNRPKTSFETTSKPTSGFRKPVQNRLKTAPKPVQNHSVEWVVEKEIAQVDYSEMKEEEIYGLVKEWLEEGEKEEVIVRWLLTLGFDKKLVTGNKIRGYLSKDKTYALRLVAKVKKDLALLEQGGN